MDCLLNEKQGCIACASGTEVQIVGTNNRNGFEQIYDLSQKTLKKVFPLHIKVGTDEKGKCYTCTICKKTFRARSQIGYHSYCDAKNKLPYKCFLCDKRFVSFSHYKYHINVHSGEKPYKCTICGEGFYQMSKLQRHKLKHTGEKKYSCEVCGKAFSSAAAVRKHRLTHTGERPYACSVCPLRFSDISNLRKHHLSRHHGKKTWHEPCGREVSSQRALAAHWRARTPGRPHACSHCPRTFTKRKDLMRHATVHSDQLPYSCKVCVRAFKRKDNLERHIRNAHPGRDTAAAVLVDEGALSAHRAPPGDGPTLAKTQLEELNPLPPLDRDLIRKHMGPPPAPAPTPTPASPPRAGTPVPQSSDNADNYIKYIMEANNARESVIFAPLNLKKDRSRSTAVRVGPGKTEECEYVHKIRKAHCMVTQKDLDLPPIDETKIIELERKTNLNKLDVGSPPKNMEVYKKILLEAPVQDEPARAHPSPASLGPTALHWRAKMKLNAH
ncbi:Zinc finger protein 227 [Eumeta japonica]|uniref:Zinc finger protein 227 n=1 Tax=Eumeta variegata TaxID=151549 RepID=A0A4C1Z714_EUMVA|nr:Zinc finger protein 227 [Eumeta japonica]